MDLLDEVTLILLWLYMAHTSKKKKTENHKARYAIKNLNLPLTYKLHPEIKYSRWLN